jgi:hypothetical protein
LPILALKIAFDLERATLACWVKSVFELEHHQLAVLLILALKIVFELEKVNLVC